MKHDIISMSIGEVEPLVSPQDGVNPATNQPWPPREQQINNPLYKNGSVGRKFLVVKSMPKFDPNNFSVIGLGKVDTEVTFLGGPEQIALFQNMINAAAANPLGFLGANAGKPYTVEKQTFDVEVPPFYWVDDNKLRRKDEHGNLTPIINKVRIISSIQDGKPAKDIHAEAIRMVRQFGKFVDTAQDDSPYTPPVDNNIAAAAAIAAVQGGAPVAATAGVVPPTTVPPAGTVQ